MSAYLDLDDVAAPHPKAAQELAELRTDLARASVRLEHADAHIRAEEETVAELRAELAKRNQSPSDRLHNICAVFEEHAGESPFSREEWERMDAENTSLRAKLATQPAKPIDMILYCPNCDMQHIDKSEAPSDREWSAQSAGDRERQYWTNPPHRSHLCHGCGHIWRPADVPTNGVAAIMTKGQNDSPVPAQQAADPHELGAAAQLAPGEGIVDGVARIQEMVKPAADARALRDVVAERRRQIEEEDWTPDHDDEHVNDELAAAACFYAMPPEARDWPATDTGFAATFGGAMIPEGWMMRAGDRRRDLVKAAALILAEIERLDRAALGTDRSEAPK